MTNYIESEEDTSEVEEGNDHGKGEEEVAEQNLAEFEAELLRIKNMLRTLQLLKERENNSSATKQAAEENCEVDSSSVIIRDSDDGYEESTYNTGLKEDNHFALDDSEGDDDAKSCFLCPFCYVDIEVPTLCSHLEEEHCFDFKNAVCPLCAANLGRDVIGHFMVHHASSFKHRRKPQRSSPWTGSSAMRALLKNGRGYVQESAPDPLLSPFICNVSFSEPNGIPQDVSSDINAPVISDMKSAEPSLADEVSVKDIGERRQRATFVQQLISSTIFSDL